MRVSVEEALKELEANNAVFATMMEYGTMAVEIYKPEGEDHQQPHDQDELYVVVSGQGIFNNDGYELPFKAGDVLFVPAGKPHFFQEFSEDFLTWVIFYGKKGGE